MSKYSDSAKPRYVLVDGNENVNAADECNQLLKMVQQQARLIAAMRSEVAHVLLHAQALDNRINPKVKDGK